MTDDARKMPASIEAEQAVIGGVLIAPATWAECSDLVPDDFMLPAHRAIWEAIRGLTAKQIPIDVLLVADALATSGDLDRLDGGSAYLTRFEGLSWNVPHYAAKVRDAAGKRRLLVALGDVTSRIYAGEEDIGALAAAARAAIDRASVNVGALTRFGDIAQRLLSAIEDRTKQVEMVASGVRFGIDRLDALTAGLQPKWLIIIAAETGGGKTALAMQAAINCVLSGGTALACNLEMTIDELGERALVHVAALNSSLVRIGRLDMDGWARIQAAAGRLDVTRFYLEDALNTIGAIASKARLWRARHPDVPGVLIVDFVQLVRGSRERGQTRAQEIGIIAQDLKALAKELNVPVILISQLNRAGVKAERPSKSDLKESGDLENASDLIVLPWNKTETVDGDVAIIVDKFRHGERMTIPARWVGRHYRFENSELRDWRDIDNAA